MATPTEPRPDATSDADLLLRGELTVKGRMPWSSNGTFLVEASLGEVSTLGVYKPERGERPLWDFPPGLYRRELAAYLLSEALGWGLVPLTVQRDGPYGEGSVQLFVRADFEQHYFTLVETPDHHEHLRRICVLDLIANNADRKSGHCLLGPDGIVYAIDNGLCFHTDPKLRTVIWGFGGEPIPPEILTDVRRLVDGTLPPALAELLEPPERRALLNRARAVLRAGRFPADRGGRYPWPVL
jgi:uncharacterized repeat protein (TIGR03843 family)